MQMPASEMPPDTMPIADHQKNWVLHATLEIGQGQLLLSDNFEGPETAMTGASVMLSYDTAQEAAAIFEKLADGGQVTMPFQGTFWSAGFGSCIDRFGINWMIGTDAPPEG